MERHLTSVCAVSLHTKIKLSNLKKRNENFLEKMRIKDIQQLKQSTNKRPTLANLDYKINTDVVLPQTILNYGEY